MRSIASKYRFCQQVVKYSLKYGVTKASSRYRICRKVIYDWRKKYDGTWRSLLPRSHRPHHHPREHTAEEYELIRRMNLEAAPSKRKEYKPKPYARAEYPGQKVQIDVKYVPTYCVVNGMKYY